MYRLTSESRSATPSYSRTYGYDLNGNPTTINGSSFATFDNANKFSTVLTKTVTQDNDGNITAIATSPFTFTGATWDNRSKMTRATITAGNFIDYRYLYDGKRFYSKASSGTTSRIYYIFAGDTLIGEITTSTPTAAYTWGSDGLISRRNLSSSTSSWYEFGAQGETGVLTNNSGASTDTYNYNGYGELIASSGSTTNPYRYGGKYGYYTETYTGLVLATQRWYLPNMMRWISRDPIGYEGGSYLFEYVGGNPIKFIDPTGFKPGDNYSSADAAARDAIRDINQTSIKEGVEFAGYIYKKPFSDNFSYTEPKRGTKDRSHPGWSPWYHFRVGDYHTHGSDDPMYDNENFSQEDKDGIRDNGKPGWLGTPKNKIKKYYPDGTEEDLTYDHDCN